MRVWREVQTPWWRVVPSSIADIRKVGLREWLFWQRLGRDHWWGINYEARPEAAIQDGHAAAVVNQGAEDAGCSG